MDTCTCWTEYLHCSPKTISTLLIVCVNHSVVSDPLWSPSVQFSSVTQSCPTLTTPCTAAHQASLSITISRSLLKLMSIRSVMSSKHLILCHPLLLLPSIFPSIRVFSNQSVLLIRWPKCWSFSFSISPSNEFSGLTSFRIDQLDLLAGQGTLKSLIQHHTSKASFLWCSAFFMVQLSHPYMTTGPHSESESEIAQSCPTLCNPVDCRSPGSSIHGFPRQEYWSGLPFLSPTVPHSPVQNKKLKKRKRSKSLSPLIVKWRGSHRA
ncbi:unnamed protein product [Rangifer tarandus platyrhynchus]|uniref:Uncharacterized protein n=2 Tax=Rangifer tarandus platyrhynchus TaxID=3082113 RepID=A0ABN8Z2A8_RANTA|nr:unnamed protein product [Rangifer tarandus platyrhynchus]